MYEKDYANQTQDFTYRELNLDTIWGLSWEQSKKYAILIILNIAAYMCQQLGGMFINTTEMATLLQDPSLANDPDRMATAMGAAFIAALPMIILGTLLAYLLTAYVNIAIYRLLLDGVKGVQLDLTRRLKDAWNGYIDYILPVFLASLLVFLGIFCCILPGIFLSIRLLFVPIIAANHPELTLSQVFSKSWNLTRGHFWTLLGYGIVAILINIVGIICCCIGVIFTQLITQFMLANVYYTLSGEYEEETEDTLFE